MTTYRITGTFPPGCDGYHLTDYASAAGVELDDYATEEEARAAADRIEATPDADGIAPTCDVVRSGYRLIPCDGEAHTNPHIDNCLRCAPRWGWVETKND